MAEHGSIWWTELMTSDTEGARRFYSEAIGWTPSVVAMGDMSEPPGEGEEGYTVFMLGDTAVCGAMKMDGPRFEGVPPHWFTYVAVDDVDAAARKVAELGGEVLRAPFDVPQVGRIAIIKDPQGAVLGLGTPDSRSEAAAEYNR
ncbi:MAG: VOC family protein [Hyphomicrobiales bacterium]|nr:VOC family protein [Hyphomicrobiales bacterium]